MTKAGEFSGWGTWWGGIASDTNDAQVMIMITMMMTLMIYFSYFTCKTAYLTYLTTINIGSYYCADTDVPPPLSFFLYSHLFLCSKLLARSLFR